MDVAQTFEDAFQHRQVRDRHEQVRVGADA
jgi:hypothetical protein